MGIVDRFELTSQVLQGKLVLFHATDAIFARQIPGNVPHAPLEEGIGQSIGEDGVAQSWFAELFSKTRIHRVVRRVAH